MFIALSNPSCRNPLPNRGEEGCERKDNSYFVILFCLFGQPFGYLIASQLPDRNSEEKHLIGLLFSTIFFGSMVGMLVMFLMAGWFSTILPYCVSHYQKATRFIADRHDDNNNTNNNET